MLTSSAVPASGTAEFADGTLAGFQVVGRDPLSDLAVIRADREVPAPPEYGDASSLLVGSLVVAVGNPLGPRRHGDGGRRERPRPQHAGANAARPRA